MKNPPLILLLCFVGFNCLFFFVGIFFEIKNRLKDKKYPDVEIEFFLNKTVQKVVEMGFSDKATTSFGDFSSFWSELKKIINRKERNHFSHYNYPRAFLLNGLTHVHCKQVILR